MTVPSLPAALAECAREPIHIPGAIQPHGALLAMTMPGFAVTHFSSNVETVLGLQAGSIAVGTDLRQLFLSATIHDLGNTLQAASMGRSPERLLGVSVIEGSTPVNVIAHATADGAICEFTPVMSAENTRTDAAALLRAMIARLSRGTTAERLLSLATQQVRAVTGYDRVMIYRFRPDYSGVVVAEAIRGGLEPYLGLHYPASDIPPQARELYRRQPLRQIPDVHYTPVPILPTEAGGEPLDLTLAQLRSVSPIHLEYLDNMGSAATLTISIMRGDALWGLIACHHERPRLLSSSTCVAMELFAKMFSLQLEAREQASEIAEVEKAHAVLDALRAAVADRPVSEAIGAIRSDLQMLLPHDGIALWIDGRVDLLGTTPPPDRLPELARHLSSVSADEIYETSHLGDELPDALRYTAEASGVLAVPLSRGRNDFLLFFRREQRQTVAWGGDPNKPVTQGPAGGRIGPRHSFSAWKETVRGASLPWRKSELQLAALMRMRLLELMLSRARLVDENRQVAAESQKLLVAELGHRVKNIFALIRSVVRQSRAGATTVDAYAADLERRLGALAVAHDQVTQVGLRPASLRQMVEEQSRTWGDAGAGRFVIDGPPVRLDVRALQSFALVLHELMTNAAKYGALSADGGSIDVRWTMEADGLSILWREQGGPVVSPPTRRGFGTIVIEQTLPFELQGRTDVRYAPTGVEADFFIPADHASAAELEEAPVVIAEPVRADLRGSKLLVVEDSMMIALDAQAALEAIGATVEIASSVADGLRAISFDEFTGAVLDVNLRGETSSGLADALIARRMPFIFATGYGDKLTIPERFRTVPKVAKPYDAATIANALRTAEMLTGTAAI